MSNTGLGNSSGATVNSGGTLELYFGGTVPDSTPITLNGNGYNDGSDDLGALYVHNGDVTFNNAITLATTSFINTANASTFNGVIGGSGDLIIGTIGAGSVNLGAANNYGGNTTINNGTVNLNIANGIPDTSDLTIGATGSATFNMNSFSDTIGNLMANPNSATIDSGFDTTGVLTITQTSDQTFSGVITGNGSYVKNGAANLTLTGDNDIGPTTSSTSATLNAGTLTLGNDNAIGYGVLVYNGGLLTASTDVDVPNSIDINANFTLDTSTHNVFLEGAINDANAGYGFTKLGSGNLTLNNHSTYTGSTTISAGKIILGIDNALPSTALINDSTLDLASFAQTVSSVTGSGVVTNSDSINTSTFTIDNSSSDSYGGTLTGNMAVVQTGTNTLTLSGNNSFTQGFTGSAGTVVAGHNNAFGTGTLTLDGGTLQASATRNLNNIFVVTSNGATISGGSNINFINTGTLNGTLTVSNSAITQFLNDIDGVSGMTQTAGTSHLSGNNIFGGAIIISGGTMNADSDNALGATSSGTTVSSGATLAINSAAIGAEAIALNSGALSVTGTSSLAGDITLGNGSSETITNTGAFTMTGDVKGESSGQGDLIMQGSGSYSLGIIGSMPISSLHITSAPSSVTLNGNISSANNQIFDGAIALGNNISMNSSNGEINFGGTIDGANDLTLSSSSGTTFGGAVGNGTALNSLTISAGTLNVDGGAVKTVNSQNYSGNVALGADATFTTTGTGNVTLSLNNGISGNKNISLVSNASANENFVLGGSLAVNNVTVNGGASGSNSLTVNTSSLQTWSISATDTGSLSGITGVGGAFNFNHVGNLNGGNAGNNFVFADNVGLSGSINGGSLAGTNTLDFSAYTTAVTVNMPSNIYIGTSLNSGSGTIVTYTNINYLKANPNLLNLFTIPSGKAVTILSTLNSTLGTRYGFIADPTYFYGFYYGLPTSSSSSSTTTSANTTTVAQIIQQPTTNNINNVNAATTITPTWITNTTTLNQNITALIYQATQNFDADMQKIKINPYCMANEN